MLTATANGTAGSFSVQASAAEISTTADFNLTNTNTTPPEIVVRTSTGDDLPNGGSTQLMGNRPVGAASTIKFEISNEGLGPLVLTIPTVASSTNISSINLTFANSSAMLRKGRFQFGEPVRFAAAGVTASVTGPSSVSIPAGGSMDLIVDFSASASGSFAFTLGFFTNDSDEFSYTLSASGTASVPSGLAAVSGSGQSADIGTQFATPLVAIVRDGSGNGVAGINVTFAAPATGPSVSFAATGGTTQTVTTGSDGLARSSVMTANTTTSTYTGGSSFSSYMVTASASGLPGTSFSLSNRRDSAADIQKTKEVIAAFVTNRADRIVSGQPDIVQRLMGGGLGSSVVSMAFRFR